MGSESSIGREILKCIGMIYWTIDRYSIKNSHAIKKLHGSHKIYKIFFRKKDLFS